MYQILNIYDVSLYVYVFDIMYGKMSMYQMWRSLRV